MMRLLCLLAVVLPFTARAASPELLVDAAASLTNAFTDIGTLWMAKGNRIKFNFASSSELVRQIEHGEGADVFASADELWMDRLAKGRRIETATCFDLVGNTLVLVEKRDGLKKIELKPGADLAGLLGPAGRLAVGDPAHVPVGIYAEQALRKLGLWESVKDRLAPADSVRAALMLVERGETNAGIVYSTDVRVAPAVSVAATFPADTHEPIRYPVAVVSHGHAVEAAQFLAFLRTQPAQDVFLHYGFTPP
jgi:molybdate transport system substrate-binding protein